MNFQLSETDKATVFGMLKSEQTLRYSDQIQNLYDQGLNTVNDPEFIEKMVQKSVLEQYGYNISEQSLRNYQAIGSYYINDDEIKNAIHYLRINIIKDCPIPLNSDYVDVNLVKLDGTPIKLSSLYNTDKPLVILAGSITWPPFRHSADVYKQFYHRYKEFVDIICIYILEAHFVEKDANGKIVEGWPIGKQYQYPQHKNENERINMANKFINEYKWPIPTYIDSMDNDFNNNYSAWPDRAYLIFDNQLLYFSKINNDGSRNTFWTHEIENFF